MFKHKKSTDCTQKEMRRNQNLSHCYLLEKTWAVKCIIKGRVVVIRCWEEGAKGTIA
jgi:hypothetical protein